MTNDLKERFIKKRGPLKAAEIAEAGYSYKEIQALENAGEIKRIKSGYYVCPQAELSEEELVFGMFPDGVFTMETALFYHGYLPQRSIYWSVAVSKNTSKSRFKLDYPIIHPFYAEPKVLESGVIKKDTGFGCIMLYEKDRLMCEVLKYRDKMDKEDFKIALRAYIDDPDRDSGKFIDFAKERRVMNLAREVIGPWL